MPPVEFLPIWRHLPQCQRCKRRVDRAGGFDHARRLVWCRRCADALDLLRGPPEAA